MHSFLLFMLITFYLLLFISGSPHTNLNQNNLKYGTDNNRISTQIQEPTTPPQSPNKNSGQAEKIVLLVCNRACAGQQGRRYWTILKELKNLKSLSQRILLKLMQSNRFVSVIPEGLVIHLFCIWSVQWHGMYFRKRSWRRCSIFCAPESLCRYILIPPAQTHWL